MCFTLSPFDFFSNNFACPHFTNIWLEEMLNKSADLNIYKNAIYSLLPHISWTKLPKRMASPLSFLLSLLKHFKWCVSCPFVFKLRLDLTLQFSILEYYVASIFIRNQVRSIIFKITVKCVLIVFHWFNYGAQVLVFISGFCKA